MRKNRGGDRCTGSELTGLCGGSFSFTVYFLQDAGGIRAGQQSGERELHGTRVSELPLRWFPIIASQNENISTFPKLTPKELLDLLFVVHVNNSTAASQPVNAPATYHRISQQFFILRVEIFVSLFLLISRKRLKLFFFLLQHYLYQLLSRSRCGCQYCVCLCRDVCCASLSFSDAPVLRLPLLCLPPFLIPPLVLWKAAVLSPSLTVCLMFGPWCCFHFARDIKSVFSSLSLYSSWHFGVDAVFAQSYLTAISGFIFALSLRLSQRCCLYAIVYHNRGGDLSLWQHCKMLPGMCWCFLFMFFFSFLNSAMNNNPEFAAWFSKFCSHDFSFSPRLNVYSFCLGCVHIFSSLLNTFCSEGICLFPSVASIFVQHLCMSVFTRLQMSAVAFASEHGVIQSRWLASSKGLWQLKKVRTESTSHDRKGRKS